MSRLRFTRNAEQFTPRYKFVQLFVKDSDLKLPGSFTKIWKSKHLQKQKNQAVILSRMSLELQVQQIISICTAPIGIS